MNERFTKERDERDDGAIIIRYRVDGFWSEQISVSQGMDWKRSAIGTSPRFESPSINRSCGGQETDDSITAEFNFAAALLDAIKEAKRLDKRTGKPMRPLEAKR